MGKIEELEGVHDDKKLTVVWDEGDAENSLSGGVLIRHKLILGVGKDLRQQLISNIRAVLKVGLS